VIGSISGRQGGFVHQDAGTGVGSTVSGGWFVVPRSGTGDLTGLRGAGGFTARLESAPRSIWTIGSRSDRATTARTLEPAPGPYSADPDNGEPGASDGYPASADALVARDFVIRNTG
jgi:hypothetical protein